MGAGEAAVAVVSVAGVFTAAMVLVWQAFSTWRARIGASREQEYRQVAEQATAASRQTAATLEQMVQELAALRERVAEVERLMKEVD